MLNIPIFFIIAIEKCRIRSNYTRGKCSLPLQIREKCNFTRLFHESDAPQSAGIGWDSLCER